MWIDFEGIDGSGKTTLSNAVAGRLREEGLEVVHLREEDRLGSRISELVRDFTRNARHLELADRTELLLNCAREVQLWEELLKPSLARGQHVIADRSIYSHLAVACGGRGVPWSLARQVATFTADGLWPDLVVFVDTEPALAKARKRSRKLKETSPSSGSRKGLAGAGLPTRMRDALAALAAADPARWLVLDNDGATLEQLVEAVVTRVQAWLAAPVMLSAPTPAQLEVSTTAPVDDRLREPDSPDVVRERFFAHLAVLGEREPGAAACLLSGLEGEDARLLRERLAFAAPEAVAWSLGGCVSAEAWRLRRMLVARAPRQVAASLTGLPPGHRSQANQLREALLELAPGEVAASLAGLEDEASFALRRRLYEQVPAQVLASLAGVSPERAWSFRDVLGVDDDSWLLLPGLAGDDGERAWRTRDRFADDEVLATLTSLTGVAGERAHTLRKRWIDRAPRTVLRSVAGVFDEPAWSLRARWVTRAPEALGELEDVDDDRAWALREQAIEVWPAKVLRSLGALHMAPRGRALVERVLASAPRDLSRCRALVLAFQAPVEQSTTDEIDARSEASR